MLLSLLLFISILGNSRSTSALVDAEIMSLLLQSYYFNHNSSSLLSLLPGNTMSANALADAKIVQNGGDLNDYTNGNNYSNQIMFIYCYKLLISRYNLNS